MEEVVDQKYLAQFILKMILRNFLKQVDHCFLKLGNPVVHHLLGVGAGDVAAQLVNSRNEDNVFLSDAVKPWLWVLLYVARSRSRKSFNDELKHRSKFWPQSHADAVMVKVENGDFQIQLHESSEVFIDLDAEK